MVSVMTGLKRPAVALGDCLGESQPKRWRAPQREAQLALRIKLEGGSCHIIPLMHRACHKWKQSSNCMMQVDGKSTSYPTDCYFLNRKLLSCFRLVRSFVRISQHFAQPHLEQLSCGLPASTALQSSRTSAIRLDAALAAGTMRYTDAICIGTTTKVIRRLVRLAKHTRNLRTAIRNTSTSLRHPCGKRWTRKDLPSVYEAAALPVRNFFCISFSYSLQQLLQRLFLTSACLRSPLATISSQESFPRALSCHASH